jgi:hypothetical protein
VEWVVLDLEVSSGGAEGDEEALLTFLPITPRQAIDGIAILGCGVKK